MLEARASRLRGLLSGARRTPFGADRDAVRRAHADLPRDARRGGRGGRAGGGGERVGAWAVERAEVAVAVMARCWPASDHADQSEGGGARAQPTSCGTATPSCCCAGPASTSGRRGGADASTSTSSARRRRPAGRAAAPTAPAIVVYTSGTTGPPKGAVLPRRAIASNLDALAEAWEWTDDDVRRARAAALPRARADARHARAAAPRRRRAHLGRFSPRRRPRALAASATMLFAVPTMYHRLAAEAEAEPGDRARRCAARGCSSPGRRRCPPPTHERIERLTGQRIVERYGMTETLMNTGVRADGERRARATSDRRCAASTLRLVDDDGEAIEDADDETIGEIHVRGPNLFLEYLNRPDATAEAMTRRLVPHRRPRHPRAGRLHPDRRAARDRPDQERRLQDRRRRDRGRAARASRRRGGRGHRRARPGPRRADRGVGRRRPRASRRPRTSWPATSPTC